MVDIVTAAEIARRKRQPNRLMLLLQFGRTMPILLKYFRALNLKIISSGMSIISSREHSEDQTTQAISKFSAASVTGIRLPAMTCRASPNQNVNERATSVQGAPDQRS